MLNGPSSRVAQQGNPTKSACHPGVAPAEPAVEQRTAQLVSQIHDLFHPKPAAAEVGVQTGRASTYAPSLMSRTNTLTGTLFSPGYIQFFGTLYETEHET
jgi:hypothetical protein